jgi:hypothetical protein
MCGLQKKHLLSILILTALQPLFASKFVELQVLDQDILVLYFQDGEVEYVDDGQGPGAFGGHHSGEADNSYVVAFAPALDLVQATDAGKWTLTSSDDERYGQAGVSPQAVYRKSRVNGMSYTGWDPVTSDHGFDYTHEHFIYLRLPFSMQQGKTYTVEMDESINAETSTASITFDIFNCPSKALHTNLVGYMSSSRIKAADLYHFMGDGGNRDYSDLSGNTVYIYNVETRESQPVGSVAFWMENKTETNHNLTGSDVWTVDFTGFTQPGTYRLAVQGVGCSQDFEIRDDIYHDPFKVAVMGYFYMRIGQDNLDMTPVPRRPLFIPDQSPANCTVYITDMDPYHPQWSTFAGGDKWDAPANWAFFKKTGNPSNPHAIGGHSDALDWDRHLGHVVNVYDLCLAYILSDGTLDDDDLRIAESGNGIPDILDEARNEVDFWLNLRYQKGYSHGLTNPDKNNNLYQADNTPIAAWANALNSAMLAYCFQIAGLGELRQAYQDSAVIAFDYAGQLSDPMWETRIEGIRGIDFKMMTAAYLYNLTGDTSYEDIMSDESMITSSSSAVYQQGSYHQLWGVAAYLLTRRPVHYPELQANMKAAIMTKAKSKEAGKVNQRPSRRGYSDEQAWWQTSQDMHRTILAHAVADNPVDRLLFLDALLLEADWGLGRNPLNMIQMTTATTELADKNSVENCYTSGRDDGTPGLHPGHTPYLNIDGWGGHMVGSNPKKILAKFYPDHNQWPHASKYIDTRHIWAHSEFTPRQTMRGKTLLYAYLYALSQSGGTLMPTLVADAGQDQRIVDQDGDGKERVTLDASASYAGEGEIVRYSWMLEQSELATNQTVEVELDTGHYEIILEVEDSEGSTARDTITIEIIASDSHSEAEYGFETGAQFDAWIVENWGDQGGTPVAIHSSERAHSGMMSYKIRARFESGSEHVLRRNSPLPEEVISLTYHVWIPQVLVDSALAVHARDATRAGGIQNYLMHEGWQWVGEWFSIKDLEGDEWNELTLEIPAGVSNASVQSFGMSFSILGIDIGEASVYIDDICFNRDTPTGVGDKINEFAVIPTEFKLLHAYPNPFNPDTNIIYHVPRTSKVMMNVYDITGRKVCSLVDEVQSPGSHRVVFNGRDLASGVYLYTLETFGFMDVKKMILLK